MLADFRPNLGALRRHVKRYGPEAAQDFTDRPVTAQWRIQHVLVPTVLKLDGPLIDLTDVPTRQEIEDRHVELLLAHGPHKMQVSEYLTKLPDKKVLEQRLRYYSELLKKEAGEI